MDFLSRLFVFSDSLKQRTANENAVACVASVPVRAQQNNRAARRIIAFGTRREGGGGGASGLFQN